MTRIASSVTGRPALRDITLEVMRQEAEAEVRKTRRVVLDDLCGACFELSLLPAWTPRLLQRLNYSADPAWLEALVDQGFCFKKAARRVWRQATPAVPEYAVYEVTEQWRTWVLDMVVFDEHHHLATLQNHISRLATAIQPLVAEDPSAVPEATRYWALLAWQTDVAGFQQTLQAHVDDALADNQNHRAMAFVTCARRLLPYLEPRAALVVEGAARRLEVTRRRQADADKLRHYLVRESQVDAFYAVLDDPKTWALHYLGMGGMGKTMLLRYLLSERRPGRDYIAARIDFDFLDPDYPSRSPGLLLEALGEELRVQDTEGHTGTLFTTLSNEILGFHEVVQLDEAAGRHVCLAEHPRFDLVLSLFADMIRHLKKPVVFLLDTCEELVGTRVDGNRIRAVIDTFAIFEALRAKKVDFTLVFAGRRPLAKAGSDWTIHPDQAPALPARDYLHLFVLQPFSEREAGLYFDHRAVAEARREDLLRLCRTDVSLSLDGLTDENAGVYYSPFDCALYCDWLEQEPDLDLSGAAEGEDRYVARRVVGRITDNTLQQWLPAMALLGRFDQATFTAFVDPIPEETAQVAWLDCTGLEWVNAEGAFLAVLDGLRGRLLRWFKHERPSAIAAAKTRLLEILGQAIADNPTGVDPEYVIDVIRLSDRKRLALWWPALRDLLVKDSQFERLQAIFRRLAVKADLYGEPIAEAIALDALLLEARDHAWDAAFNWRPFLANDETGRAFFAYLTQYSAVIDEFADRLFAASPQPLPSFGELKAALMVLGLRVAPPGDEDQPVLTPGCLRLEAWRRRLAVDRGLAAAVLKACEAYLAWREATVQRQTGNAVLRSLLETIESDSDDNALRHYAAFLQIRFENVGRRRTTLQKALRGFIPRLIANKPLPVSPDLYWSTQRDLTQVMRYFLLRYWWQGILNFDDVQPLLYEQHDQTSARFCSFFVFHGAESVSLGLADLEHYPNESLPLQLQIPRDLLEHPLPELALIERLVLDAPQHHSFLVEQWLTGILEKGEASGDGALIQQAIQLVVRRQAAWFAPLPQGLSEVLKRGFLPVEEGLFVNGPGLDWIHGCWTMLAIADGQTLAEARKVFQIKDRSLATSHLGLEVALDQMEFNRLATRLAVPPMGTDPVDWARAIHTIYRKHPLQHVKVLRLMLRRWALGLGRKPNFKRFKARLGARRMVLAMIDLARATALRLPDCAYPLYQVALEYLPPFNLQQPRGLHLICYADMWYCRSLPGWAVPPQQGLPDINDLMSLYQFAGEPLKALGDMLAAAQTRLHNATNSVAKPQSVVLPVQAPIPAVEEDDRDQSTLSFSLSQPEETSHALLDQVEAVIRQLETTKMPADRQEYSVQVGDQVRSFLVNLNDSKITFGHLSELILGNRKKQPVVVLFLESVLAGLPAWDILSVFPDNIGAISNTLHVYRRFVSPVGRDDRQKGRLVSALLMSDSGKGSRQLANLWRRFEPGQEGKAIDILHIVGRPSRLGNGEFRLGLGDTGHRKEGDLLTPEAIGKRGPYSLVLIQMPVDVFDKWHWVECAYGRGFAGTLVEQGFAGAVLFIPPLTTELLGYLHIVADALATERPGHWPTALLRALAKLRKRIVFESPLSNRVAWELAGQISLTTGFEIDYEPLAGFEE